MALEFETHLRFEKFISNEMVIYTTFFTISGFPIQFAIYTKAVGYTT